MKRPASRVSSARHLRIGAQPLGEAMRQQGDHQAVEEGQRRDRRRHHREGQHAGVMRRVDEQREERHVEHDRLRVEQGDRERLAEVLAGADVQHRLVAGLGEDHAQAQPGEVGRAEPLHRAKRRRICGQQRRHAGDRQPHQHLVADDDAERRRQAAADAALAGGGDEGEVAGPRDHQEDDHGDDERCVVGDAEEHGRRV